MWNLLGTGALAITFAFAPLALGQRAAAVNVDEATLAAVQRYRSANDPAEARRAFDELRARAATSSSAALACGLLGGRAGSVVADRGTAMACLRLAAKAGSPEAQYQLAVMLLEESGPGAAEHHAEAERLLGRAAASSPESVYLLAKRIAQRSADARIALRKVVEDAARAGYAPAQRELAHRLMMEGARVDALAWLEKAWAQGDAEAGYELASLLAERRRDADVPKVIDLLERSARLGSARAALALGVRLLNADGVKRDTATAHVMVQQAASAGLAEGQYALGYVLADGLGVAANEALALQWYEAAARQGHLDAMYAMGNAHANGWGTGKSLDMAYRWYCRAAQKGHDSALQLVRGSALGRQCDLTVAPPAAEVAPGRKEAPAPVVPR